ncbi:Uncharacterised protein [uncultured archaeon]|nr:Uncharacterised protein [uncultured archaeon]
MEFMNFLDAPLWYNPIWTDLTMTAMEIFAFIGFLHVLFTLYSYYFGAEKKDMTCQYHDVCRLRVDNELNRTPTGMFSYKMQEYYKKKFYGH